MTRRSVWLTAAVVFVAAAAVAALWERTEPLPAHDRQRDVSVLVLAGDGVPGVRDGDAARARFADPFGVAVSPDGSIYVADGVGAHRIRRISPDGRVVTLAGWRQGFRDGPGAAARFDTPSGLAVDAHGAVLVADTGNNAIRRLTPDGRVTTVAGGGAAGYRDGPADQAQFNGPVGVAVDRVGRIIVADTYNDRIRIIEGGMVRTLEGAGPGGLDGEGPQARLHTPTGVVVDPSGNIHVADAGNSLLRTIDPTGRITTPVSPPDRAMGRPIAITVDAEGRKYVSDEWGRILEADADGAVRILAGSRPGFRDGSGSDARFRRPSGVALAAPGRLVVADAGNSLVRLVAARSGLGWRPPPSPRIAPRFDPGWIPGRPLLWPVAPLDGPHEIAGTIGETRGSAGEERFHAGIDVRVEEGAVVSAVRDGTILSPVATEAFGTLNESLRIGPLSYVHLRVGRARDGRLFNSPRFVPVREESGRLVAVRARRGATFSAGEAIGSVNRFNHVHLTVGWPGEEQNPLALRLTKFEDNVAPTIAADGVRFYDDRGQPLAERAGRRVLVSGRVQIVVDAWDEADGGRPGRRLGLYDLGYQVLQQDGQPARGFEQVRHTMRFDRLAPDPEAARLVYAAGSGIPFYGRRRTRFLYVVTNTFRDGVARQAFWDTTTLAPGDYIVRVWAADIRGNAATSNRDVAVRIAERPIRPL